ncbi:MAG: hypothetical protein IKG17_09405 [Mogibacterium sp.]|nr:hypothetical protein [Mogibacterium sp.]
MNILVLNGSPRPNGNTAQMINALFSYNGDFLGYLGLEDMGVFTHNGYDPGMSEEELLKLRQFGESL